jgi:hypothetical protein
LECEKKARALKAAEHQNKKSPYTQIRKKNLKRLQTYNCKSEMSIKMSGRNYVLLQGRDKAIFY